jgi:predicted DNA-binding protein
MFKRVFSRKNPENVTKSIRITNDMAAALQHLADEAGETLNSYIVLVLDQYLQVQLEEGKLTLPLSEEGDEKSAS